jgi:arylsulfatase A-like enzyme
MKNSGKIKTGRLLFLSLSIAAFGISGQTMAQYSPQQPFKGKIGNYLKESVPAKTEYNKKAPAGAPNVVWILIDDAGFGSSSTFGGLVETPNLDKLANQGLRFTNFHTTAICSPTRAALLTGRNHHSAHVGLLTPAAIDFPGYDIHIPFEKATVAEIFRENGYNTFALGKWHATPVVENSYAGPFNRWPTGRGFDHFFGFHPGATDQWHPELWEDQTKLPVQENPEHLNKQLTDKAISYIANQKSAAPDKPFFLYFATGATHAPHQVAKEWSDKYKGKFDIGWDKYREIVIEKQRKLGVIPSNAVLPEPIRTSKSFTSEVLSQDVRNSDDENVIKKWDELSEKEKKVNARFMEIYAGFFSYTDYEIGRIIDYLDQIDQLDNTLIFVVIGDNGASKEGTITGTVNEKINRLKGDAKLDAILQNDSLLGLDETSINYPLGWAQAANTPFRYWKQDANSEGGTHNPLIVFWPKGIKDKGGIRNQYGHVIDVLPTSVELAHLSVPSIINGYKQDPIEGTSLVYAVSDSKAPSRHTVQYYEIAGSRAIYKDGWKAGTLHAQGSSFKNDVWELYNLNDDFNERIDLAAKHPEKLKEMQNLFDSEAKKYNVYPLKDFATHRMPEGRSVYGNTPDITLYPGVDHLTGVNNPLYDGKSFEVAADVEIKSGKEEGVLFAIGGEERGISLFIQNGKLQFAHKTGGQIAHIVSNKPIPTGRVTLKFEYKYTGANSPQDIAGTETIYINNEKVGERNFTRAQSRISGGRSIDGTDVGRDLIAPVSNTYAVPFEFTGKLKKINIHYSKL